MRQADRNDGWSEYCHRSADFFLFLPAGDDDDDDDDTAAALNTVRMHRLFARRLHMILLTRANKKTQVARD